MREKEFKERIRMSRSSKRLAENAFLSNANIIFCKAGFADLSKGYTIIERGNIYLMHCLDHDGRGQTLRFAPGKSFCINIVDDKKYTVADGKLYECETNFDTNHLDILGEYQKGGDK